MRLKDKILVAAVALLIITWLIPPTNDVQQVYRYRKVEAVEEFVGFHFIFFKDRYRRELKIDWAKLSLLNLAILGAGGAAYFLVSKKGEL